jgi:hypothetical protein
VIEGAVGTVFHNNVFDAPGGNALFLWGYVKVR